MEKKTAQRNILGEWHHIDADGLVLGRLATKVSQLLQGKHRVDWSPHMPGNVFIVITNTDKVALTGNKEEQKEYRHFSGYAGGLKRRTVKRQRELDSTEIVWKAVSGMLPKNKLRNIWRTHLKLYKGAEHPHQAQIK